MLKNTLIIALIVLVIYLYYQQNKKPNALTGNTSDSLADKNLQTQLEEAQGANLVLTAFLKNNLNSNNLEELKTKLGEKNLDEILEENEDYETEVDTLTRTKNSLEADLLSQSNAFQSRLKEKDREVERLKNTSKNERRQAQKFQEKLESELNSEKQQHKGSLERISKLTEQIQGLEKKVNSMPGEFPTEELTKQHQAQLRKINTLFDEQAKDYPEIDFKGLYSLLEQKKKELEKK